MLSKFLYVDTYSATAVAVLCMCIRAIVEQLFGWENIACVWRSRISICSL